MDIYNPPVYKWFRCLTTNEEDLKDIMQEAFICSNGWKVSENTITV